jgi:D-alanyl-D-alanine endopeptidase (penicillin-binding protein 7)
MLVESSNDAAYALAAHASATVGVDLVAAMNERAYEMGMIDSTFTDPAGLDDTAFSTPRDLIKLVRAAQRQPLLWEPMRSLVASVSSSDGEFTHVAENTNQLLGEISDIVWGKTGYTDGALGCMILVVEIPNGNGTLVSIILGSRSRFTDTRDLMNWVKTAWRWH